MYNKDNENAAFGSILHNNDIDNLFNDPFTFQELEKSVKNLELGKSTGPSGIISERIKTSFNDISPILLTLYNHIFETGQFPSTWGQSIL